MAAMRSKSCCVPTCTCIINKKAKHCLGMSLFGRFFEQDECLSIVLFHTNAVCITPSMICTKASSNNEKYHTSTTQVPHKYHTCTAQVPQVPHCTTHVPHMYHTCITHVPHMYHTCTTSTTLYHTSTTLYHDMERGEKDVKCTLINI